jgi:superfamily II DNA/RNA helicase
MTTFNDFSLDAALLKVLAEIGYETPTPVQAAAIPKAIQGLDIVASAQTGTGKTGAFLLPALHTLAKSPRSNTPQVLILVPTRELAMQIGQEADKLSKYLKVKTVCIYGGVPYPPQKRSLSKPYDILIATPGRLMDHMERGMIRLDKIKTLVLDEADRMLDMGFLEAVDYIGEKCPKQKQTLLFSATIDKKILKISQKLQNNPELIAIETTDDAKANIEQRIFFTDDFSHKLRLLDHFLDKEIQGQAIIFAGTKRQAAEIADSLQEKGKMAEALHGDMNQRQRSRAVDKLRRKQISLLVATDVAARGIDIPSLQYVINLDLPFKAEDYVHRIGRTGRAGAKGDAVTFVSQKDKGMLRKIEDLLGGPIAAHTVAGLEPKARNDKKSFGGPRRPFTKRRSFQKPQWKKR